MSKDTLDQADGRKTPDGLGFDPNALREKYRQERDKRIRPDGSKQFVQIGGKFRHFGDDAFAGPREDRIPRLHSVHDAHPRAPPRSAARIKRRHMRFDLGARHAAVARA